MTQPVLLGEGKQARRQLECHHAMAIAGVTHPDLAIDKLVLLAVLRHCEEILLGRNAARGRSHGFLASIVAL